MALLEQEVGPVDLQRFVPTSTLLCFCDFVPHQCVASLSGGGCELCVARSYSGWWVHPLHSSCCLRGHLMGMLEPSCCSVLQVEGHTLSWMKPDHTSAAIIDLSFREIDTISVVGNSS